MPLAGVVQQWEGRFGQLDSSTGAFQPWPAAAAAAGGGHPQTSGSRAGTAVSGFFPSLSPGPLYTGAPSMQALCAHMAQRLEASGQAQMLLSHKVGVTSCPYWLTPVACSCSMQLLGPKN